MEKCPHCHERLPTFVDAFCPACRERLDEVGDQPGLIQEGVPSIAKKPNQGLFVLSVMGLVGSLFSTIFAVSRGHWYDAASTGGLAICLCVCIVWFAKRSGIGPPTS